MSLSSRSSAKNQRQTNATVASSGHILGYSRETSASFEESEEEDSLCSDDVNKPAIIQGYLCKWTNYIHGWQERFIVCKEGTLSYYRTPDETLFGCRGALSLAMASIKAHQLDECRFDVIWGQQVWYLRANSFDQRHFWLTALEEHRSSESGYGSENNLMRYDSLLSITSNASQSITSTSSAMRSHYLREKINEMEHFRTILCKQVDTLQSYFDVCANVTDKLNRVQDEKNDQNLKATEDEVHELSKVGSTSSSGAGVSGFFNFTSYFRRANVPAAAAADTSCASINLLEPTAEKTSSSTKLQLPTISSEHHTVLCQHGTYAADFHGEAITFKATTAGIIAQLTNTLELMLQSDEKLRHRLDKEVSRRRRLEEAYRALLQEKPKAVVLGGPDVEEGPTCAIGEDEFFDAFEAHLDKMEPTTAFPHIKQFRNSFSEPVLQSNHPLFNEISRECDNHLANMNILECGDSDNPWSLIDKTGDMRVYHREIQEHDGSIINPLLAINTAVGFSAREICEIFWDLKYRLEWEEALSSAPELLESLSEDTVIVRQVYKRIWPAAQRDAVFWSRIVHKKDVSMVVNYSTDYPQSHLFIDKNIVRLKINVALICQTIFPPGVPLDQICRNDLRCKVHYHAYINPGGWAPSRAVREITRKEGPKFVKRFTQYVGRLTGSTPIKF